MVKYRVEWADARGFPWHEDYITREEAERVVERLRADGIIATITEVSE